jgi:hypothetical protein
VSSRVSLSARRWLAAFLVLAAAFAGGLPRAEAEDAAPAAVPSARDRVRALAQVDGSAVGDGGAEGAFFALARELLAQPDAVSARDLLADASPVARAMGLYLLVRTKGKDALPDLRAHLPDRTRFVIFPGGCCGWPTSVGGFARALARNRRFLEMEEPEPLADAETLLGLDLAVLADDRAANQHDTVRLDLDRGAPAAPRVLRLADLRRAGAGLSDLRIVKAAGRMTPSPESRALLVACLDDATLDGDARLAAASGLTRDPHPDAAAAIRRARAFLDAAAGKPTTERLLATIEARRAHEERWKPIRAVRTWKEQEALGARTREALSADRPLAIPDLVRALGRPGGHRDVAVASVFRIAARLGETSAAWDTDSEAAHLLETLAVPAWEKAPDSDGDGLPLLPDERKRLLETLRPHLSR